MKKIPLALVLLLGVVSLALFAAGEPEKHATADAAPPAAAEEKPAKPATEPDWHAVKPKEFTVTATLSGVFESQQMERVELAPEEWQTFKIIEVAPLGMRVSKGDMLIRFETDKIDRALGDAELGLQLAELNLAQNQQELATMEKTTPLDLASAERGFDRAREDHKRFVEVELPLSRKAAEMSLATSNQQLAYAAEELKQLEQMYREDELTEETEEIILKRQQWAVERAQFGQEQAKTNHEEATTLTLPRRRADAEMSLERAGLNWDKSKATLPLSLDIKRKTAEKMVSDVQQAKEKLERLRADRKLMELQSPIEGLVYYGECVNGKWPSLAALNQSLRAGSSVKAGTTLFTVVTPSGGGGLIVRSSVAERQLTRAPIGAAVKVTPTAFANRVLTGSIRSVSPVPISDGGNHEVLVEMEGEQDGLVPGMSCEMKVEAYRKSDALTVPVASLESDETGQWHVKVRGEDGSAVKRAVKLGWRGDSDVEVLEGLKAGDQVHPAPSKPAEAKSGGDTAAPKK